ncbi:MAG: prepilin-type N-terminal cleavage/methylation domain-containing protein [Gallionella sp.]|nr:prepilin-type N-terminal cleavage/methylation domain-containing protein [Gallionella sp.]
MNGSSQIFPLSKRLSVKAGFTLVELAITIVIIGVLAAAVAPRFYDVDVFQSRGFADQVQATLRYAQKAAIAKRRNVCVAFTDSTVAVSSASASGTASSCNYYLMSLTGWSAVISSTTLSQSGVWITAPSGTTFSTIPQGFKFDSLGRPSVGTFGVIGTTTITVETETGYVH